METDTIQIDESGKSRIPVRKHAPAWLDYTLYPFKSKFLKLPTGNMHYVDEGDGETLLFIHGTPTWSFLYRHCLKELSSQYRCIAMDHLGFGLSDKPADFNGNPETHAENIRLLIEHLNLTGVTLVVHDFGGPIGLGAAIQFPERIKRIVLLNSWCWETKNMEAARKVDRIVNSLAGKFLYLNLNFSPRLLMKQGFYLKRLLTKKIHLHYINPFPDKLSRTGLLSLAKSLVGSSRWYEDQWQQLDVLTGKPWLILWGMQDRFISPDFLEKWVVRIPQAKVCKLNCGHFIQEEMAEILTSEVRQFLNDT